MKNKRGISLIVLIITIIVIVVLATAIIVSLARNNPVENAKEATFKNDVANIKDAMNLVSSDILLGKIEDDDKAYNDLIPEKYKDILYIENGVLYYIGEDAQEEEWASQIEVFKGEKLPTDWINIAKNTPRNGLSLLMGKPENQIVTIRFKITSTGTYSVDWGDGTKNESCTSGTEVNHTYSTNNDKPSADGYLYEVKITPESGDITKFQHTQYANSPLLWLQVGCDTLDSCGSMLQGATNLKKFGIASKTTLSKVTDMSRMFSGCTRLTNIPNLDTSNITNMYGTFIECSSLKTIPKLDTSQVTDMSEIFSGCSSLNGIPLLDINKVTNINYMFEECSSLKTIPLLDTSKITDMEFMFYKCSSLETIPKLDTSQVTSMYGMFQGCSSLESIPELDTSKVENMKYIFSRATSLKTIPLLDTSQVTDMGFMLDRCTGLENIPLLNTSNVTNMDRMLRGCSNLKTIPEIDTRKVVKTYGMFWNCSSLETVPKLEISQVTNMESMFLECNNLKSINLANANLTNEQIDKVFDELPTSTNNAIIDITGNPGESSCTRVTATDKGWTVIP